MKIYYKCAVKVEYENDKGQVKFIREDYIVHAISPTDVESKITKYLSGSDFEIVSISQTKIISIIKE